MPSEINQLQNYLTDIGFIKKLAKGEHLFIAGQSATAFYLLQSGAVRIYKSDAKGQELEIRRVGPGEIFAEVFVFTENCFPFSAVASMDTTLLYFPKERILEKIKTNQELALFFIQLMAKRCLKLNQVIENIGQEELPIRLARYLLRLLADQPELVQNNQATIQLTIPKKDLASQLATIPETLSRVFEKLQQQNLLQVSGKTIFIFDVKNLQSLI